MAFPYPAPSQQDSDHFLFLKIAAALYEIQQGGGGGDGTVTSVGLSLPSIFTVSGSPITTTGTLTGDLATQAANTVFAGPANGGAAAPTFRALVAADMVAAGSNTQVQYNNSGALGADAGFTYASGSASLGIENVLAGQLIIYDSLGSASGSIVFHEQTNGFSALLVPTVLTADRTILLPDGAGVLALAADTATLGANTFTALQTITQAAANAGILASTGYSLTGANATSMINLAGTLNTTGVVNVIYSNITNTASGAGTRLFRLDVGGSHRFSVDPDGTVAFGGSQHSLQDFGGSVMGLNVGGTLMASLNVGSGLLIYNGGAINLNGFGSCIITRDSADHIIAMRSGANAQTFRAYGTYTDASNYVRASLASTSTLVTLAAETAGTGADNVDIDFTTAGTGLTNFTNQAASADAAVVSTHTARVKFGGTEYKVLLATP